MNAPENTPAAYPINLAHEVLMGAKDAMCVEEVTREIVGKKPTKAELKPVAKLLKELADLGLIEMEPRAGGVPFYRLIVASESLPTKTYPPETLRAMIEEHEAEKAGELSFLAPEDYEMPPADPTLLASANRMLCDRLEAKDAELLAQAKVVIDLRNRLDALTQQWEADTGRITADLRAALESRSQVINEADRLRRELTDAQEVTDAAVGYLVRVTKRKPRRDGSAEGEEQMTDVTKDLLEALKAAQAYVCGPTAWTQEQEDTLVEAMSKAIAEAEAQQDVPDEAWDDIKLAEMIMSDCGFSSRYAPLKERIAKRIAKHVAAKTNPQAKGD